MERDEHARNVLVVDNGLDLLSDGVRDVLAALRIDLLSSPARNPWANATVECAVHGMSARTLPSWESSKATALPRK